MSDVERLNELMESGALLHPVGDTPSIVDFANALHDLMGVPDVPLNEKAKGIKRLIGEPDHLVLVLADGFGMNFVEGLDGIAFIPNHLAAEMRDGVPFHDAHRADHTGDRRMARHPRGHRLVSALAAD